MEKQIVYKVPRHAVKPLHCTCYAVAHFTDNQFNVVF